MVNPVSMCLLAAGKDASLNGKGAYLEVLGDMPGSIGVITGKSSLSVNVVVEERLPAARSCAWFAGNPLNVTTSPTQPFS